MIRILAELNRRIMLGLADSNILPIQMSPRLWLDPLKVLENAGVVFGEKISLFYSVTLPKGWKIIDTEELIFWHLIDDRERKRATIKYDPFRFEAELQLNTRFNFCRDYDREKRENIATSVVTDNGKAIHTTKPIVLPQRIDQDYQSPEWYQTGNQADSDAESWLDESFPNWRDPAAYWD